MSDYKLPRQINYQGDVYINVNDLIGCIEDHKEHVGDGRSVASAVYKQAHDHIIDLIQLVSSKL